MFTGAGISCNAGIPDFRTPGSGLYDNLKKYNLPHPTAVFDLEFYKCNPLPFVQLASELWPGMKHSPTVTHSFIALLERKGVLLRNYTQVRHVFSRILLVVQFFLCVQLRLAPCYIFSDLTKYFVIVNFITYHNDRRTLICSMY